MVQGVRDGLSWALLGAVALGLGACAELPAGLVAPVVAGVGAGLAAGGPTLKGQVQKPAGGDEAKLRVGLVGSVRAGAPKEELTSAAAVGGQYSLSLPSQPAVKFLEAPSEDRSIVFSLVAYTDANGNGRYDEGSDTLHQASSASGTFRYFAGDGPAGTYKAGWNLFKNGAYTQSFDSVAFNVTTA